MPSAGRKPSASRDFPTLGEALRQAWIGYRLRLDQGLAEAGFGDRGFPDGRVLRICARSSEPPTISDIARELAITRQGASKVVNSLRDRSYVTLGGSAKDGREKVVALTQRAVDFLAAQRRVAREIERELRDELGQQAFEQLHRLVEALGGEDQSRMSDYLRATVRGRWPVD